MYEFEPWLSQTNDYNMYEFEPWLNQTNDYDIYTCRFSFRRSALLG